MAQELASALERHLMTSIVISAVVALIIVAALGLVWWRGRRWVRARGPERWPAGIRMDAFSRRDDPERPPDDPDVGGGGAPGGEPRTAAFIREAAARAGALRDEWDRSYREARSSRRTETGETAEPGAPEPATMLEQLLVEQRETNALLRDLIARLRPPAD